MKKGFHNVYARIKNKKDHSRLRNGLLLYIVLPFLLKNPIVVLEIGCNNALAFS